MAIIDRFSTIDEFAKTVVERGIILIGGGKNAKCIVDEYDWNIKYIVDNNIALVGGKIGDYDIVSWEYMEKYYEKSDVIVITPEIHDELERRVNDSSILSECLCYIFSYMKALQWDYERNKVSKQEFIIRHLSAIRIPKIIHYFWFSGDPFPEKIEKCLESWKRMCPDYEFIKWDLTNYHTDNKYCLQALEHKKWAFASDFGRCDVVYRYGGVYLDLDVELIKPIDDLLHNEGFFVFESRNGVDPGSGFGAVKGNSIIGEIRDSYYEIELYDENEQIRPDNIMVRYTHFLEKYGLKLDGKYQNIAGISIYPPLVMSPYSYMTGILSKYDKTYGIHHWVSAWISEEVMRNMNERKAFFAQNEERARKIIGA